MVSSKKQIIIYEKTNNRNKVKNGRVFTRYIFCGNIVQVISDTKELVLVTKVEDNSKFFSGVRIATTTSRFGAYLTDFHKELFKQFEGKIKITI